MGNPDSENKDSAVDSQSVVSQSSDEEDAAMGCGPCDCPPTAHYSLGTALILIGALMFVICCCEVVPGYDFTRDFNSKKKCTVNSTGFQDDVCCESAVKSQSKCEKGYDYPCAQVTVTYEDGSDVINAVLYDNYKSRLFRSETAKDLEVSV